MQAVTVSSIAASAQIQRVRPAFKPASATRSTPRRVIQAAYDSKHSSGFQGIATVGLGALMAAQLALVPIASAGPELPGNLNNPFGKDIQDTRDASKMPANRSEVGGAAQAKGEQAEKLAGSVGKSTGRDQLDPLRKPDETQQIGSNSGMRP